VLALTCQDLSVAEIAFELGLSESTIASHRHNIFRLLRVKDALGALRCVMLTPALLDTGISSSTPHPIGCPCPAIFCSAMRISASSAPAPVEDAS
jgi:hypothetical protein